MKKTKTLQVSLMTSFALLLILTVSAIIYYIYINTSAVVVLQSQDLLNAINQNVVQKTEHYFEPLKKLPVITATSLKYDPQFGHITPFMKKTIRHYPQIANFYIADTNGNMTLIEQKDHQIRTKIFQKSGEQTYYYWEDDPTRQLTDYNPKIRPWYLGAQESKSFFMTDVYVFFASRRPGITASYPVLNPKNRLEAVVGVDIDLIELSHFLGTLNISENGIACIIDNKSNVIAYPDASKLIHQDEDRLTARYTTLIELEKPEIIAALQAAQKAKRHDVDFKVDGVHYIASISPLSEFLNKEWTVLTVAPIDDFVEEINKTSLNTLIMSTSFLGLALILASLLARNIAKPIVKLTKEANRIREFDLEGDSDISSRIKEISLLTQAMKSMKNGLKGFRKYVPAQLVREMIQQGIEPELGGEKRDITLLFTDIADFTSIAESLSPEQLNTQLGTYLNAVSGVIRKHEGTIDKFIGDAVMAFWGAPKPNPNQVAAACTALLELKEAIDELNTKWVAAGQPPFLTRCGLHTGQATVGNFGAPDRMNYTAVGDCVNIASRIEGLNKRYDTQILISEDSHAIVRDAFVCRLVDIVAVKGKTKGIKIYELIGKKETVSPEVQDQIAELEAIFELYQLKKFKEALGRYMTFKRKKTRFNVDEYIARCKANIDNPPKGRWDGIFIAKDK